MFCVEQIRQTATVIDSIETVLKNASRAIPLLFFYLILFVRKNKCNQIANITNFLNKIFISFGIVLIMFVTV